MLPIEVPGRDYNPTQYFDITETELSLLSRLEAFSTERLPPLIGLLAESLAIGSKVRAVISDKTIKDLLSDHWFACITGKFDKQFNDSGARLGTALYVHDVPVHAIAQIHSAFTDGLECALCLDKPRSFIARGGPRRAQLRAAIGKALRISLELLLYHCGEAQRNKKRRVMGGLAQLHEETLIVVKALSASCVTLGGAVEILAGVADGSTASAKSAKVIAEKTSSHVKAIAGGAEDLAISILEIDRKVIEAVEISKVATEMAERADTVMQTLVDGTRRTSAIAGMIKKVSTQTSLLALNATIEAARAGTAGKGFAVVASELKRLAHQSALATDEVTEQVSQIQSSTGKVIDTILDFSRIIDSLGQVTGSIALAVRQQTMTTQEIALGVSEAAKMNALVSGLMTGIKHNSTSVMTVATDLSASTAVFKGHSDSLLITTTELLQRVKAA